MASEQAAAPAPAATPSSSSFSSSSPPSSSSPSPSAPAPARDFDVGFPLHTLATTGEWLLAAGGGGEAKTGIQNGLVVFRWDKRRLVRLLTHDTGSSAFHRLALHPSEPLCAAVTLHGELSVFSFGTEGVKVREGRETGEGVTRDVKLVAFAKQGDELATVDTKDTIRTLTFPSLRPRHSWAGPSATADLVLAPAGDFVYALSDKQVAVFSRSGQALYRLDTPLAEGAVFRALACTADGRLVVSAMRKPIGGRGAARKAGASFVQVYEAARAERRGELSAKGKQLRLGSHHTCMGASSDGRFVALGTDEGGVHTFRTDYASLASATPRLHEWVVSAVAFDPAGRAVVAASVAYTVKVRKVFGSTRSYWNLLIAAVLLVLLFYVFATFVQPAIVRLLGFD